VTGTELVRYLAAAIALLAYTAGAAIRARRYRRLIARLDRLVWLLELELVADAEPPAVLFDQDAPTADA
jgi:hypothetical protein